MLVCPITTLIFTLFVGVSAIVCTFNQFLHHSNHVFTILTNSHQFDHFSPFWPFLKIPQNQFFHRFIWQKMIRYAKVDGKLSEKLNWLPSRAVEIFHPRLWTRFSRFFYMNKIAVSWTNSFVRNKALVKVAISSHLTNIPAKGTINCWLMIDLV